LFFSPDGKWIIIGGNGGYGNMFGVWDVASGQEIKKFDGCYHPKFSKNGKSIWYKKAKIAAPSDDRRIIRSESIFQLKLEDNCLFNHTDKPVNSIGKPNVNIPLSTPSKTKVIAY
jgi:WD40 repeat protein